MNSLSTEQINAILQKTELFSPFSTDELNNIQATLEYVTISANEILIKQDTHANSMYIILSGQLIVKSETSQQIINKLKAGDIVGELGLLTEQKRNATVTATVDTRLLECTRRNLDNLLERHPALGERFRDIILPRIRRLYMLSALNNLIDGITLEEIEALEARTEWIHLNRGDVLFSQGEQQDDMYLLVQGRLRVIVEDHDIVDRSGEIEAGETVGELGLLSDEPRAATVKAIRDSYLIRIDRGDYHFLLKTNPTISANIASIIIKRQHAMLKQEKTKRADSITFAVVPLDSSVNVSEFAEKLEVQLQILGETRKLNGHEVDTSYGYEGASNLPDEHPIGIMVEGWMIQLENDHDYVLYVADPTLTEWTQRCIEASDRILLVGSADQSPNLTSIEKAIQTHYSQVRQELILLHPEMTQMPSGTAQWLDQRKVKTHHHIRLNDTSHYSRVARRLTGHAIGLVFSGGGARGYVQLGVIRALEEANVQIDMVAGTSIGALIAGAYALRQTFQEVYEVATQFSNTKMIFDYTFPIVALNNSTRVSKLIHQIYGDVDIEDLWIPYFNIASNMSKAEMVVSTRGKLHKSIRGSMSIPGIFTPVLRDGDLIVDGGIVNNFPIDIMAEMCEGGTVIGLTAQPERVGKSTRSFNIDDGIPGWRILLNRLNPFTKNIRVPILPITLLKTLEINTLRQQREYEHVADLLLNVDTQKFKLLAFDDYEIIAQAGYDHSKPIIKDWVSTQPDYLTQSD